MIQQTALKTEKLYTVKETADFFSRAACSVTRYCKSGKLKSMTVTDNGGIQYRISESSIKAFAYENNIELSLNQTFQTSKGANVLACLNKKPPISFAYAQDMPEKAKEIGIARFNLVKAWDRFRDASENKSTANDNFIKIYQSELVYKATRELLGDVSVKTLYRWKKDLKAANGNYTVLIPQYKYNVGERLTKLSEIEKQVFMKLMLSPSKFNVGEAKRLTVEALKMQGLFCNASYHTFKRYVDDFKKNNYHLWVAYRDGQKALSDSVVFSIQRNYDLINVGDILVADGHRLNFFAANPFTGKPCRATMVGYMDMKSNYLCGFEIMLEENTQCVLSAFRNAVIELGKMPLIAYQDNGKSFRGNIFDDEINFEEGKFGGIFQNLGIIPMFSEPYNSKAKPIERYWKEVGTFEKMINSYVGNCIDNRPAYLKRNEKIHKELHDDYLPSINEIVEKFNIYLRYHNSQECPHVKGKSIAEVFNEGKGSGVDIDSLDDMLMAAKTRKVGKNGVKFLNNYYYADEMFGINDDVVIKYSLFDLTSVKIYTTKGKYICKASVPQLYHPAVGYLGDAKDMENFKQIKKQQRRLITSTMREVKQGLKSTPITAGTYNDIMDTHKSPMIADKKAKVPKKEYKNISCDVSDVQTKANVSEDPTAEFAFDWEYEEYMKKQEAKKC